MTDLYALLEIERDATPEEIKKAYRRMARKLHPDVSDDPDCNEKFQAAKEAYEVLSDENKRKQYDATGEFQKTQPIGPQATQTIIQFYMQLLEKNEYSLGKNYDELVKQTISNQRLMMSVSRKKFKDQIPRIEKLLERTNGDQLVYSVNQRLMQARSKLSQFDTQIQIFDSALEQLRDFSIEQIQQIGSGEQNFQGIPTAAELFEKHYPGQSNPFTR